MPKTCSRSPRWVWLKAIDRFDPELGNAFTTFAAPTILGEIKRYFRDKSWTVRVPRDLQELALKVSRVTDEGASIAARFGVTDAALARAEDTANVERLVECLGERERTILHLRFHEDLTQAEIGHRLGISQMHVSRLIRQSIARLRTIAEHAPQA